MQVRPEQLADHLARKGLGSTYLVYGPEPLQKQESLDAIRSAARAAGVAERIVFDSANEDWNTLRALGATLSLFGDRRLIEVRLGERKFDTTAQDCLSALLQEPAPEDTFLLLAGPLDRKAQGARWFAACDGKGTVVHCREPAEQAFKSWLAARAQARGLGLSDEAVEFLALRAEGNLMAAAQEIDKLVLLAEDPSLDLASVMGAVADSARYTVFQCVDAALAGQRGRTVRVLRGLRTEGGEAIVINWSVNRELRALARVAAAKACGTPLDQALMQQQVWSTRQGLYRQALERHPIARLSSLLGDSHRLDRLIKGQALGNVWDELETLLLALAGGTPAS